MLETFLILAAITVIPFGFEYAYDRWMRPRLARRWVRRKLAQIQDKSYVPPAKHSNFSITQDDTCISVHCKSKSSTQSVVWNEIIRVLAFKQDLFVMDRIGLAFVAGDGTVVQVNEEMEGWELLTESLPQYLPGCKPWHECFAQVAFPAFAENMLVVFERNVTEDDSKNDKME